MKKTIAIISPDAVPLTLKPSAPKYIKEGDTEYPIKDKCCKSTSPGIRAWETARVLSQDANNDVTLFIPDLNFPGLENIDMQGINFNLKKYNYKNTICDWSEELDRKLKTCDFVIVQATVGAGFKNCAVLPRSVNLIVDGWVPFMAELPCALLNNHKLKREHAWTKVTSYYNDLLMRANCVLYANDRQRYYYEGQFFSLGKLGWKAFKFSPLLKVPYGVTPHKSSYKQQNTSKLKLLWFGSIYPWYQIAPLFDAVGNNPNIELDFMGARHPRYTRLYDTIFKDYFENIDKYPNIRVSTDYVENQAELFSSYDAGIVLAHNWLEEKYAHRVRILEMMSYGLPVITNMGNVLTTEYSNYAPLAKGVDTDNIANEIEFIRNNKSTLYYEADTLTKFNNELSWDSVLKPVVDYVDQFSNIIKDAGVADE